MGEHLPGLVIAPEPVVNQSELQQFVRSRFTISSALQATEYVVDQFISEGQILIVGSPGAGKSYAVATLALAATGALELDTLEFPYSRHVIYISEDPAQIAEIAFGAINHHGASKRLIDSRFHIFPVSILEPEKLNVVGDYATTNLSEPLSEETPPLIVLDTVSAAGSLRNENDNGEISTFLARVKKSFNGYPTWLIHHTAKTNWATETGSFTARGGGAFEGNVQGIFNIYKNSAGDRIMEASKMKRRDKGGIDQLMIEPEFHTTPVTTRSGQKQIKTYLTVKPRYYDVRERQHQEELARATSEASVKDKIAGWLYKRKKDGETASHQQCWDWCRANKLGITMKRQRALLNQLKEEMS